MGQSRTLSRQEIDNAGFFTLEKKDIDRQFMIDTFGVHLGQKEPRFRPYDKFVLPAGKLHNKETITTTLGRYIFNLFILPEAYLEKYGYYNETITKKALGALEDILGNMVLEDELTTKEYAEYMDSGEWLSMGCEYFLAPSLNYDIMVPIKEVTEKRDELFTKYANDVKKGDPSAANKIESEVMALAKQKVAEKENPAADLYNSGVFSFDNNYKKMSVMVGAIENPYTKKISILKSNYTDSVDTAEFPVLSNLTLVGGYARGVETQNGGYERKKLDVGLQTVTLDEADSDCGTKQTVKIKLTKAIKGLFVQRYIVENGKLKLLTADNIGNYVDKEINLRSPLCCKSTKYCNKCAGELFYKLGVTYAGLLVDNMAGTLMNASMKKFHDSTLSFTKIDPNNYIRQQ